MTALRFVHDTKRVELRIKCTMHVWTMALGNTASMGVSENLCNWTRGG
jgi:hypothetical protein